MFRYARGMWSGSAVLVPAAFSLLLGGCLGGTSDLASGGPPTNPWDLPRVAGGNDQVVVFWRENGLNDSLGWLLNTDLLVSTDVVAVPVNGASPSSSSRLPGQQPPLYADGRWVVFPSTSDGHVPVLDLESGGAAPVLLQIDGVAAAEPLALSAGRLLLQASVQDQTGGWVVLVYDLSTGGRIDVCREYASAGALDGHHVALLYDAAVPPPGLQLLGDGLGGLPPEGGQPLSDAGPSRTVRIDLFDLENGARSTIDSASGSDNGLKILSFVGERLFWQASVPAPSSSPTEGPTQVRAYDPATGQTSTVIELVQSPEGGPPTSMGPSMDQRAIGEAGMVITYTAVTDAASGTAHVRNELRGWDGTITLIQEYDRTADTITYEAGPVVVGRHVVYSEPTTGDWFVYDASSKSRTQLQPFAD